MAGGKKRRGPLRAEERGRGAKQSVVSGKTIGVKNARVNAGTPREKLAAPRSKNTKKPTGKERQRLEENAGPNPPKRSRAGDQRWGGSLLVKGKKPIGVSQSRSISPYKR